MGFLRNIPPSPFLLRRADSSVLHDGVFVRKMRQVFGLASSTGTTSSYEDALRDRLAEICRNPELGNVEIRFPLSSNPSWNSPEISRLLIDLVHHLDSRPDLKKTCLRKDTQELPITSEVRAYLTLLAGLDSVGALSELEWVREEKRGKQFLERSLVVDPTRLERAGLGGRESLLRIKETLLGALLFDVDAGALLGQLQTRYPDLEDETLHKRRYPRGSMADTAWVGDSGRAEYAHSSTESFIGDREILRVILHPDQFSMHFNDEDNVVFYGITNNGKTVLQQPGCRACGAACGVMLLMDHRKEPDLDWLVNCNLENESSMISGLIKNGLPVKISSVFYKSEGRAMSKRERGRRLEDLVSTGGSGILSIVGEIGGHFILVDHFCMATDRAVIRDPFHGWCIETTANAILERNPTRMIQVEQV